MCSNNERFSELVGEALNADVYNYGLANSGTDQQLLIFEHFARDVEADLIVLCIYIENIERIKSGYRKTIDRTTGNYVLMPKPYFTLEGEKLCLHHVPVPLHRPPCETSESHNGQSRQPHRLERVYDLYLNTPKLAKIRHTIRTHVSSELRSRLWLKISRWSDYQPYPDYKTSQSYGWQLMRAIVKRFFSQASPIPVLVIPIPTQKFYLDGIEPIYQKLYESLADPEEGFHVADVTSSLRQLPRRDREKLSFQFDPHFSPFGHQQLARLITREILSRKLIPSGPQPFTPTKSECKRAVQASTYILGLSCFYHNSAACLIKDGEIIAAAEEERFTRIKHDRNFPRHAANYCLEEGGIHQYDLAAVVYYDNALLTFERLLHTQLAVGPKGEETWLRVMPSWIQYKLHLPQLIRRYLHYDGLVLHEIHHRSHAASAFYPSPFERAAILTVDGIGEWATASIGVGNEGKIQLLKEMRFPHSLGLLYSAFTQFTGFKVNSGEYKMMGLAPYGEPKYVDTIYEHLVDLKEDGSVELNMDYFAFLAEPTMTNERFAQLFGGPARQPEAWITQREMDLARSIQVIVEEAILRMARHAHKLTNERKLCLAGGVALNCVANGRLLREGPFEDLWIQPAAGDAGSALGAALDAYHTYFNKPRTRCKNGRALQGGSYWGPAFSEQEIRAFLDTHEYPYQVLAPSERDKTIARFLEAGKVIGHFAGRAEFGPRALGARSILGDARNQDMQANLNLKIKYRESFRPFAPTVLASRVGEYFELDRESPYMLLVAPVKDNRRIPFQRTSGDDMLTVIRQPRSDIPAVTHVDYSARVQTITREDHPDFYDLIHAFEQLTGYSVIVNTSFNVRDEPIVNTPYDAYRCFMRTEMDVLILGNCLLLKEKQPDWPEHKGHERRYNQEPPKSTLAPLVDRLREFYVNEFLPAAATLQHQNAVRVSTVFQRVPTMWADYSTEQSPHAIFSIPPEIDTPTPDPAQMATAITQFWTPGVATDALRLMLVQLLEMGQHCSETAELDERVADTIYVMY
jgi:carbamoyltransferase